MGVMALVALLAGCGSSGSKIDTSVSGATTSIPTPGSASPTAAGGAASGPSATPATLTPTRLPSGASVSLARNLAAYDRSPVVVAFRARADAFNDATFTRNPLYGPLAATESGPLLLLDRQWITRMRAENITLHGRGRSSIVKITQESPTEMRLENCNKDDASWYVYSNGRIVQGVVTKNWLPYVVEMSFVGGRWVMTGFTAAVPSFSCAAAV
ncbi:MAG: hypothetical protein ACQSGP_16335 [Frankia sp.]